MARRKLLIPKKIKKIVPLGSAMRFITYLKAIDKVVGIEAYERKNKNESGRPYTLAISNVVDNLPVIGEGGPNKLPDFEKIISVKPDLIITMGLDLSLVETIQQKTNLPVLYLSYGGRGFVDLDSVKASLTILGRLLDKEKRAKELVVYLDSVVKDLYKRTSKVKNKPKVYVGAVSYAGRHTITSTQGNYFPLKLINGNNVVDVLGKREHLFIDKEKIIEWDPDFIFLDTGGFEMLKEDYSRNPDYFKRLRAVKEKKVFSVLPFNFYHTNIEIALANAYYMGKIIYPHLFKDIDIVKKTEEIIYMFNGVYAYEKLKSNYLGYGKISFKETIRVE
ncbi:MAG: iron ABC transporter substrate-binding protein [Proteobacteria bacterium]|nr:iron ABC transporter substrate-binding protein [Pseudomonadota bacterium]